MDTSLPIDEPTSNRAAFTADDLLRAAQGNRVVGLTDFPRETPHGRTLAGTRDFWTPFQRARAHGFILIDLRYSGDTLRSIWQQWTILHELPFVAAVCYPKFGSYHVELHPPPGKQWSPAVAVLAGKAIYIRGVVNDCWSVGANRVWLRDLDEAVAIEIAADFAVISMDPRCAVPVARWQMPDRADVHPIKGEVIDPAKISTVDNADTALIAVNSRIATST